MNIPKLLKVYLYQLSVQMGIEAGKSEEGWYLSGRAVEELGKLTKNKDASLETKAKITHAFIFSVTKVNMEVGQWRRLKGERIVHLKYDFGGEFYR